MQDSDIPLTALLVGTAPMLLELAIYYLRPEWLASFALLPLGAQRRIEAPKVLSRSGEDAGYRKPGLVYVPMGEVVLPSRLRTQRGVGGYDEKAGFLWLRLTAGRHRAMGTARITAALDGDDIVLTSYWLPAPLMIISIIVPWMLFQPQDVESFFFLVVGLPIALIVNSAFAYFALRREVEEAMLDISNFIRSTGAANY